MWTPQFPGSCDDHSARAGEADRVKPLGPIPQQPAGCSSPKLPVIVVLATS
jgi:hypothetical protein